MRNTKQKTAILNLVNKLNTHPTAKDLGDLLAKQGIIISTPTIYRLLNQYCEEGLIKKMSFIDCPDHFDFYTHQHSHFLCNNCGKIYDIDVNIADIDVGKHQITDYDVVLRGICHNCLN